MPGEKAENDQRAWSGRPAVKDQERNVEREGKLRAATDGVVSVYLVATAFLLLIAPDKPAWWGVVPAAHLGVVALIWLARTRKGPRSRLFTVLRDWYPVFLMPPLFKEVEFLARRLGDWRLTAVVQKWDLAIFRADWSLELSRSFPWVALSELLHFSYFAYLLLVPAIGARWYLAGCRRAFGELVFLVVVTAYASYLFFVLFPVDSPFYLQPPPGKPFDGYPFYNLVHIVSGHGGARGGAFPSAHVSITTAVWLAALRNDRRLAGWLLPVAFGIFVATVYGRFHYVLDVFAGWTLALLVYGSLWLFFREETDARKGRMETGKDS